MTNQLDEIIDFRQLFFKVIKNWPLFAVALLLTFSLAFAYNRYTHELYSVETSILIKEDSAMPTASDLLYDNMSSNNESLENKELMIKSYPLVHKTLKDLRFDIGYFIIGNIKVSETFHAPILLNCNYTVKLAGESIEIIILNENSFLMIDEETSEERTYNFDEEFIFHDSKMSVSINTNFQFDTEMELPKVVIKFYNLKYLTQSYQKKINTSQKDRESTVLNISILSEDQLKGVTFLNQLTYNYIQKEIEEKNIASNNTVKFINDQLIEMSDSLALIEQQIQEFKNDNKVIDLSLKAQSIYANIVTLETELAKSKTINNYYDYLSGYLLKGSNLEGISVPTSFGVNDVSLNSLIKQLVEIQIKKNILIDGGQVNNPAILQYKRQTNQLVLNLKEAIKTSKSANNLLITDYKARISKMESSLGNIPQVERELLSIERLQSISENIYIFLLKKRAEAKITSSSNVSDSQVLEPAMYFKKKPVSPDKYKSYLIALLCGLILPIAFMLFSELINDTIITRTDLERLTKIPILGLIGKNYSGFSLLSKQSPKSSVYEGFRALRSNLNFFNTAKDKKVYLITSSVSGEGKTYIAENLAIVFAKSGKKTLVIGADLRRPRIYADFGFENVKGISNHVLSDLPLSETILKSDIENLDVLIAGPLPSNPSDALLTDMFTNMMEELKKIYDVIVLDTPPLGLVADALTLMKFSDINLYVVRQNYTKKGLLTYVNEMNKKDRLGDIQLVFNDIKEGSGAYGYGYGYGYGFGYGGDYADYSFSQGSEYFDDNEK